MANNMQKPATHSAQRLRELNTGKSATETTKNDQECIRNACETDQQ